MYQQFSIFCLISDKLINTLISVSWYEYFMIGISIARERIHCF